MTRLNDDLVVAHLQHDLELHLEVWGEASNLEEVRALRGAISYYLSPRDSIEYEKVFQAMCKLYGVKV